MRTDFGARYSAWIASLNQQNHSIYGRLWWALNFTNKNPIATPLCDQAARGVQPRANPLRSLVRWAFPWGLLRTLGSLIALRLFWILIRPARAPRPGRPILLWSLFNHQSFDDHGFRDAYFGPLPAWLEQEGQSFVLTGQTMQNSFQTLYRLARKPPAYPVDPMESVLTFMDYLWIMGETLRAHYHLPIPASTPSWNGGTLQTALHAEIARNIRSARLPMDLAFYRAARRFSMNFHFKRVIYPFENRSWEKMILFAARESSDKPEVWGYQHAVLTPKHLNFILEPGESAWTPLPDRIVTMGDISREWMIQQGHEAKRLVTGAALRKNASPSVTLRPKPNTFRNLLVTLATDYQEYEGVFRLLREVHAACPSLFIQIRPHPVFPLSVYFKRYGPAGFPFTENKGALSAALSGCDLLAYAASTLGLDALASGLPVFALVWGDYLETDPLTGFSAFKWRITQGSDAAQAIQELSTMPADDFLRRQNEGKQYAEAYALAPAPERLSRFVETTK